jgi:serine/threonine protein phosphatase PrpC
MHLKLTAADKSDVGQQRDQNEDRAYRRIESSEDGDRGLFIVADGMGGYKAGEVASRLAVETISKGLDSFFKPLHDQPTIKLAPVTVDQDQTIKLPSSPSNAPSAAGDSAKQKTRKLTESTIATAIEDQLTTAIQQANKAILRYGEQQPSSRGLGSTVTVALIQSDHAYIANVGDSRTYLLRKGKLAPLTKDHSLVAKLVEAHQITQEEVYTHPQRNLIYRSLGANHKTVEVDIFHETLKPGDALLLCSDGLWEMVRHQDLQKVLSEKSSPQTICEKLIDMANESGGEDNITAVVVHISAQ